MWSLVTVTRAMLPLLLASSRPGGAVVVNNTSLAGTVAGCVPFSGVYNASKAAAISITETLRVELGLLGLRVINLTTGSVNSRFGDNVPEPTLPKISIYCKVKDEVQTVLHAAELSTGTDRERWAADVVAQLCKDKPPHWIYGGRFTTLVKVANHLPVGFMDDTIKSISGVDAVEKKIAELGGPKKLF